jgi:hypothetical protein
MNMSETPEKKKARLRYDNVFKTAWTDDVHFIKHSRKGINLHFVNSAGQKFGRLPHKSVGLACMN